MGLRRHVLHGHQPSVYIHIYIYIFTYGYIYILPY
jgi:hypothetical protein